MALQGAILLAFKHQAETCRRLGSPFTAHLCERLAAILDPNTALGRAVGNWPLDPVTSALALRLCGVLNMAVWAGHAPALARLYPPDWDTSFAFDVALQAQLSSVAARWRRFDEHSIKQAIATATCQH